MSVSGLRVALIASRLHTGGGAVVGQCTAYWLSALLEGAEIIVARPESIGYSYSDSARVTEIVCPRMSLFRQFIWDERVLQQELRRFSPDWVWSLTNYPVSGNWNQSVLIHDPHFTFDPSYFRNETWKNKFKKWVGRRLLLSRLHKPRRFYCQTTAIRDGAVAQLGIPVEKIGLYPPGVDAAVGGKTTTISVEDSSALQTVDKYKGRFRMFYPARCYGHKNHQVIVEAYSKYRSVLADTVCFLTISETDHPIARELLARIESERLQDLIVNLGPISYGEVQHIFRQADAMLMPTKLETFGIPFVEAMANGVPIITSDYDFVRSVCGDVPTYVANADSADEIMNAICTLRDSKVIRQQSIEAGFRRLNSMKTWKGAVEGVVKEMQILASVRS